MSNSLKDVGIGILSWYGYDTLRSTLDSYAKGNLLDLFEEKVIYFQEIDDEAREIANEYGFTAFGNDSNTGIYGGFKGLAESMSSKYVLLLENDFSLISSLEESYRQLSVGVNLLESGRCIKVCYRTRHDKEINFYRSRFNRFFPPIGSNILFRLFSFFYRLLYFHRRDYVIGSSRFFMSRPQDKFNFVNYDSSIDFFFYPSRYQSWSNNPVLIDRQFYLSELLSRVASVDTPPRWLVNGFKSIEHDLNFTYFRFFGFSIRRRLCRSWWHRQDFRIATPESGIFEHNRIGYRGY